jgi:hypothetical protein
MSKKAVLVGINYFNTQAQLFGCINDIVNIKNVLVQQYGYTDANIVSLRDDATTASQLPTRNNILTHLNQLIRDSAGCSEIWFHYSGHGAQIRDTNGDEQDGLDEIIVPSDYMSGGLITDDEIFNIVRNAKCKTMLIFDCCHSGSVCDMQWQFEYVNGSFLKRLNSSKKIDNPNVISISGCRDPQTSADVYDNESKQGVGAYTNTMIRCLKNNNYNGTILKIYADICVMISQAGFTQRPVLSCSSVVPVYKFETAVKAPVTTVTTTTTTTTTTTAPTKPSGTKDFGLNALMNAFGQQLPSKVTISGKMDIEFNLSNLKKPTASIKMNFW